MTSKNDIFAKVKADSGASDWAVSCSSGYKGHKSDTTMLNDFKRVYAAYECKMHMNAYECIWYQYQYTNVYKRHI
jgi:hypothetical protein